jgi:hypothetical protein
MRKTAIPFIIFTCLFSNGLKAQGVLKRIGHAVTSVATLPLKGAEAQVKVVAKTGGAVIGVNKPEEILQPFKDLAKATGQTINAVQPIANTLIKNPQDVFNQQARKYAERFDGKTGRFICNVATFTTDYYNSLQSSTTSALAVALQNQNPLILGAAPFAAALEQGYLSLVKDAKPIPDDVKKGLKPFFSDNVLNSALYIVGSIDITLPNIIGQGQKLMKNDYAVVVKNIIVFNTKPPLFKDNPWWWGHEVTHIRQYLGWGTEIFAYNYLKDYKKVEGEANDMGDKVLLAQENQPLTQIRNADKDAGIIFPKSIIAQIILDSNSKGRTYVITEKAEVLSVNPLTQQLTTIGKVRPPVYYGTEWSFFIGEKLYSVQPDGTLIMAVLKSDEMGKKVEMSKKVGHIISLSDAEL